MGENRDLVEALVASGAVKFGEFELSHGGTSDYYIDKYVFETNPDCLWQVGEAFAARLTDETLAGVALGAVPLVAVTSVITGNPYVIVRKETKSYGTGNRIEGTFDPNTPVVVLEDIATTGKSALSAVDALREAGATVSRVIVVVDREEGAKERFRSAGVPFESLLTATELLAHQ